MMFPLDTEFVLIGGVSILIYWFEIFPLQGVLHGLTRLSPHGNTFEFVRKRGYMRAAHHLSNG